MKQKYEHKNMFLSGYVNIERVHQDIYTRPNMGWSSGIREKQKQGKQVKKKGGGDIFNKEH